MAIFRITTTDHPDGAWCPAELLLENNNHGYEIVKEYLLSFSETHRNALYPVFEIASWKHDGTTAARHATPKKRQHDMECIVIGVDLECRDDNDIRIASKHDGKASTKYTIFDVPRESLAVKSAAGLTALAVVCLKLHISAFLLP